MAALFISHSSRDDQATTDVLHFLRAQGFDALFVDIDPQGGSPDGRNWEQELYAQLRRADAVVFIGTPDSIASRWCAIEVSLARSIGKPVIPVLVAGTDRLTLLQDVQWVDLTDSVERGFGQLLDGLRRAGLDARDSFAWNPCRSPYPGLDAFGPEDAAVFFGRRRQTAELHDRLRRTLQRGRGQFIGVWGPSGCGKVLSRRCGAVAAAVPTR